MNFNNESLKVKTYNKLSKLPLGSIKAQGYIKEQLIKSKNGMGGYLDELEPDMIKNTFTSHSQTAGLGEDRRAGWCSEISGTYWTALMELAFVLDDQELKNKVENWVKDVLKNQEEDGYLGGYRKSDNRLEDYNAWGSNWCYRALLSYFEVSSDEKVLHAVHKGLLWFCDNWKDNKTDYAGQVIIESMIVVYTYTADERLLEFASNYLDWLCKNSSKPNTVDAFASDILEYNSIHAVLYGETVKNPALVYCVNKDEKLLNATLNGVKKCLDKMIHFTGGTSDNTEFFSPVSATADTEYCNFSTYQQTYSWLSCITGEAKYGDLIEQIIFNGAQGARKNDEKAIAYFSSPNQIFATEDSDPYFHDHQVYAPCFYTACCPVQSVRIMPEFIRGMCLRDTSDNLYFLTYAPATVEYKDFSACVDTLYPFKDTVSIKINHVKNEKFVINFRIPNWCKNGKISINGQVVYGNKKNGYICIERKWENGDIVKLKFHMDVAVERLNDTDGGAKYPIAITYGALVFSLPIPEKWEAYEGKPITKLPKGWNWYQVNPERKNLVRENGVETNTVLWDVAFNELDRDKIKVIEGEKNGYVWENPPLKLLVPLYEAPNCYSFQIKTTPEVYESPKRVVGDRIYMELVPYGCTNLRITYFPRADI